VEEPDVVVASAGRGATGVILMAARVGQDLLVRVHNPNAHVGAVAVAVYDQASNRCSTSVLTVMGHRDDAVAAPVAHKVCSALEVTTCVVAGIHVENATKMDIEESVANALVGADDLIRSLGAARASAENETGS